MALALFAADWYFVNRRKKLDKAKPITADEIVGSIISLDKCEGNNLCKEQTVLNLFINLISVFEEKNLDFDGMDTVLKTVHSDGHKRVLVATRHSRNDSRGIQLEVKYGSDGETAAGGTGSDGKLPFKKSHIRSSSCDVKFIRNNNNNNTSNENNDSSKFLKLPKKCHSRTNSKDVEQEFRARFSHNRNNSDHLNIKYIINYLKSAPRIGMLNEEQMDDGGSNRGRRGHSRNHSYDRIYTANNNAAFLSDPLDQEELSVRLAPLVGGGVGGEATGTKDVNVWREKENNNLEEKFLAPTAAAIELLVPASFESKYTHSRNNSKDFNVKLDEFGGGAGSTAANLRHRRTNSKDLNVRNEEGGVSSNLAGATGQTLLHFNNDDHI